MIEKIKLFLKRAAKFPALLLWCLYDLYFYIIQKRWNWFEYWGIHLWVGKFGQGKTSAMVYTAYRLCCKYKQVSVLTNMKLSNFPKWTNIIKLKTIDDILNAPKNCIVLIDEIGTIFNSRSFLNRTKNKKTGETKTGGVPFLVFQHLCQVRKNHMVLFATSQRFEFVDKQIRDITATVRVCKISFKHPFSRLQYIVTYDGWEYEQLLTNPMLPYEYFDSDVFIQSNRVRALYDTTELVETILKDDYLTDEEIMAKRGELSSVDYVSDKPKRKRIM